MGMTNGNRLTFKQKLFVKKYIEHKGNGTQAALEVYDTSEPRTAQSIATENLSKPLIKQSIDDVANSLGVTPSLILDNFKRVAVKEAEKWSGDAILKANIEMARILGMYPSTKHANLNINMKGNIKDLNFTQVKEELKSVDTELARVLEETPTPQEPITDNV